MTLVRFKNNYEPSFPFFMDKFFGGNMMGSGYADSVATYPAVNIKETEDDFILEVAAPGLKKNDFKINYDNGRLSIESTREDNETEGEKYSRREFNYQAFRRSFRVSDKMVDTAKIKAKYSDGILSLSLPKREEVKPKPAKEIAIA